MIQVVCYFCNTLIHKGEILQKVVRKYYPNITALAKLMGYESRATIYRHFETDDLSDGLILKYAKALKYSFKDEFPDLYARYFVSEPANTYGDGKSLEEQVEMWKDMYYELLAENNRLLNELLLAKAQKK